MWKRGSSGDKVGVWMVRKCGKMKGEVRGRFSG